MTRIQDRPLIIDKLPADLPEPPDFVIDASLYTEKYSLQSDGLSIVQAYQKSNITHASSINKIHGGIYGGSTVGSHMSAISELLTQAALGAGYCDDIDTNEARSLLEILAYNHTTSHFTVKGAAAVLVKRLVEFSDDYLNARSDRLVQKAWDGELAPTALLSRLKSVHECRLLIPSMMLIGHTGLELSRQGYAREQSRIMTDRIAGNDAVEQLVPAQLLAKPEVTHIARQFPLGWSQQEPVIPHNKPTYIVGAVSDDTEQQFLPHATLLL